MKNQPHGEPPLSSPAHQAMFQDWSLFDRIVAGNWMHHQELATAIADCLADAPSDLRVLDIGSGDGWIANQGLRRSAVRQYVALDASADALNRLLTRPVPGSNATACQREVQQGDFLTTIQDLPDNGFDTVLSSYALHHLHADQKPLMFSHIHRVLVPNGRLIWIDSYRDRDETRTQYLTRLGQFISEDWNLLRPEERQATLDHIWSSDFPETEAQMLALLETSHLSGATNVWRDAYFGMWTATKPSSA